MLSIAKNQDYRPVIGSKLKKKIYITLLLPRETTLAKSVENP